MRNKGRLFFFLAALLLPLVSGAQDFREDLKAMSDYYHTVENYGSDVAIQAYSGDNTVIYNQQAVIRKSGPRYYYQLGVIEMVVNADAVLMVKSDDKTLLYKKRVLSREYDFWKNTPVEQLDSAFAQYDSVRYYGSQEGQKLYRVYMHKGPVMQADVYLDASDKSIRKVMYLYNPAVAGKNYRTVVSFKQAVKAVPEQTFVTATYVKKQDSGLSLSPRYSSYKLNVVEEELRQAQLPEE